MGKKLPFGVYFSCAGHQPSPFGVPPFWILQQLLLGCKQSPSVHTALGAGGEQMFAESLWETKLLILIPVLTELSCASPARELGFTPSGQGGKKSKQKKTPNWRALISSCNQLLSLTLPLPSEISTPGLGAVLGTDAVTKSTFLPGTSCPPPAAGHVSFAVEPEPDAPGKKTSVLGILLLGTAGLQRLRNPEENKSVPQSTREV